MKLDLTQKIFDIRGKEIIKEEIDPETQQIEKKVFTLRDYLLIILGTKFSIKDNRESFWTIELGILFSDSKNKEVEVPKDKLEFLKRIIGENKVKQPLPGGIEKEITVFFPYELGQLLKILNGEKKPNKLTNWLKKEKEDN